MEFTQIRYFYEAAEKENLSRAAEKLHISQPSLTKSIKKLEDELGVELFDRNGHKIILNENGRLFLKEIRPLLSKLDDIYDKMTAAGKKQKGSVTIGIFGESSLVDDAIKEFAKNNPDISLDVKCRIDRLAHLEITDFDMLLYSSLDERFKKYKGVKLAKDPLLLIVYKGHPLYDQKYYEAADLMGEKQVVVRENGALSEAYSILLHQRIIFEDDISTDDVIKQIALIKKGLGIGLAFKSECSLVSEKDIHLLEPLGKDLSRDMMICFKRDHLLSEAGMFLKESMEQYFRDRR